MRNLSSARFLFTLPLLSFTLKKPHQTLCSCFLSQLQEQLYEQLFLQFGFQTKISVFGLPELNGFWITLSGDGLSIFSHPFASMGNKSGRCSPVSPPDASARMAQLTHSCKVPCWETQWPESPLLPPPRAVSTLISPSASPDGHLLLFFQMVSCRGDKAQRLPLQLSCLLRPLKS